MANRLGKRNLIRWNDDHDKELLLWIVFCCNEQGIKIPYARIAQCLGPSFTEGAIIQHLAKVRIKMEAAGLHVPPVQKRGTVTRTASSIYRPTPRPINAPVPRTRPAAIPNPRAGNIDNQGKKEEDDEDEAKDTADPSQHSPPTRQSTRKSVKRRSASRKASQRIKEESDEEALNLYDSDKEYGAKRPGSKKLTSRAKKQEGPLNYHHDRPEPTDSQQAQIPRFQGGIDMMAQSSEMFPGANEYNLALNESYGPESFALPLVKAPRRKSSAMDADEDDDDADFGPVGVGKSKDRAKKGRGGKVTKKQKVDKANDTAGASEAWGGFPETADYDADRAAMPPPALPNAVENSHIHWNNDFMAQPFADHSNNFHPGGMGTNSQVSLGFAPANNNPYDMDFTSGGNNLHLDPLPYPSAGYHDGPLTPVMSGANTRNSSFASASSNSTIDSQPSVWNQPVRSPGFPNPQEASLVLQRTLSTPDADESTHVNIFGPPLPEFGPFSQEHLDSVFAPKINKKPEVVENDPDSMFVGAPEEQNNDGMDFAEWLDDSMASQSFV